ncbi:hypothetical protein V8C86DRAFT_2729296 [Haematococcus lacustris]
MPQVIAAFQALQAAARGTPPALKKPSASTPPRSRTPSSQADLLLEIASRSQHHQQVQAESAAHKQQLLALARQITSARFASIEELQQMATGVEAYLAQLSDERAVLKSVDAWPHARWDIMREVLAVHADVERLLAPSKEVLDMNIEATKKTSRLAADFESVHHLHDNLGRACESLTSKCKSAHLPSTWLPMDMASLKRRALAILATYMRHVAEQVTSALSQRGPCITMRQQLEVAITFSFKAHQFTGGFDEECEDGWCKLEKLLVEWNSAKKD